MIDRAGWLKAKLGIDMCDLVVPKAAKGKRLAYRTIGGQTDYSSENPRIHPVA